MTNSENEEGTIDMSMTGTNKTERELLVEQWLKIRKEAGSKINPDTAEVMWSHELTLDPYGVYDDLPEEYRQVGREYFARSPDSDIWVWFGDLPDETGKKLWEKYSKRLSFPAGIFSIDTRIKPL